MSTKTVVLAGAALLAAFGLLFLLRARQAEAPRSRVLAGADSAPASERVARPAPPLGERVPVASSEAALVEEPRIPEGSSASILLHVSWEEDGAPAAGVNVELLQPDDPTHLAWQEARTGADGVALLEDVPAGRIRIRFDRGGGINVLVRSGERTEAEAVLPRAIDVAGRVVGRDGRGVAGASVLLFAGGPRQGLAALSDAEGRFEIRDVGEYEYVGARAPDREPSKLAMIQGTAGSRVEVTLVLDGDGGSVEGTVLDTGGRPISGALVCVGDEHVFQMASGILPSGPRMRTGEDGAFRVDGVRAGSIPVTARARGFAPARLTVDVRPGETTRADVRFGPGATLEGRVLEEDGAPISGAEIAVGLEPHARQGDLGFLGTRSGPDGRYELTCVPAGEVEVSVEAEERGRASERGTVVDGERRRLDFRLARGNVIAGVLVDAAGNALAGCVVEARITAKRFRDPDMRWMLWNGRAGSGEDGSFSIANCPPFEVTLSVYRPGGFPRQVATTHVVAEPPASDLRIVVPEVAAPAAWIRGWLRVDDGGPIPALELYVFDAERRGGAATRAEIDRKDGTFRVGPFGAGSWGISVESEIVCPVVLDPIEIEGEGEHDAGTIDLVRAGFVRVEVAHREAGEWKKVWVLLKEASTSRRDGEGDREFHYQVTGTTWRSPPLKPGWHDVSLRVEGRDAEPRNVRVRPGEDTLLEIAVD